MSDEVCQVKNTYDNPCGRRTYKDKKKCIFHLENKSDEEGKIFENEFWKELKRMEKDEHIKELDFTSFIFSNQISFENHLFKKPVNFMSTQFNKAFFSGAQFNSKTFFSHAKFNNDAHFSGAQFTHDASFSGVTFNNEAFFFRTQFNNEAFFFGAQFNNEAHFSDTQFNNKAHFSDTQFNKANFSGVKFNNEANFIGAQFNNEANFIGAQFNNEAHFSNATFNEVNFIDAQFNNKADFLLTKFNNIARFELSEFQDVVSFISVKFSCCGDNIIFLKNVRFHKPKNVRFQNIDLSDVSFLNTDVSEVEFLDVKWARKNGRLAVIDETLIGKDAWATYGSVAQLYRRLRRNYETSYRFAEAGEFFIGEMEMLRLDVNTNIENEKMKNIVLWFKRNFSLLGLYKYLSLYGESYVRPIILTFTIVVSYPLLINLLFHWIFNDPLINYTDDFLKTYPIRESAASFFQMDSTYIIERILGILILGLLFIALKRQFERKK